MARLAVSDRIVTVFGGSGFLGRHVVGALAERGWRIRVAVRRPELASYLRVLGAVGQINEVQANLRHMGSIRAALDGADAAVNLVGIAYERGRQRFAEVHVAGARRVAEAAAAAGATAMVHVSALGAEADAPSAYARSKAAGERAVHAAFPDAVIVRPSLVFGPEDQLFNRFAAMARLSPAMPLVCGASRFQPVFCDDAAKAVALALEGRAAPGTVYEIGGPEIRTMEEIVRYTLAVTGRRRLVVPVPTFLARLVGRIGQLLPTPPLTADQVAQLAVDNLVSSAATGAGRTLDGLGIRATAIEVVVPSYLYQYRRTGQFDPSVPAEIDAPGNYPVP
ncbi:MAG TPA: complex I NDUFA9 subunit family protein [Hyphomicrobiales bacterium]|nr:complex I NDUFA9 subunit family protein [Hyphomicrobiales bacterium]